MQNGLVKTQYLQLASSDVSLSSLLVYSADNTTIQNTLINVTTDRSLLLENVV